MNYSAFLRRNAAWGLAVGVLVACSSVDTTPPSTYGYPPSDAGFLGTTTNAAGQGAAASSGGAMSAAPAATGSAPSSSGAAAGSTGGNGGNGGGTCPTSCSADSDCASCSIPAGSNGVNCCVMKLCAMMTSCPVIRDAGNRRDGS
jgi:hypothetical protein